MGLSLNTAEARKGDSFSSQIRDTGAYKGVITRAEKLKSDKGTEGVGLSFKADDGATANYLDVYTTRADGSQLWGHAIIQSLLCCAGVKDVADGEITFDKWDNEVREVVKVTRPGYPSLMGRRIGLVLQKELQSHYQTGADQERINIVGVFQADTDLTATEILDKKTKPERLAARLKTLMPFKDSRKRGAAERMAAIVPLAGQPGYVDPGFNDDIAF
jgi:hypothetical protein